MFSKRNIISIAFMLTLPTAAMLAAGVDHYGISREGGSVELVAGKLKKAISISGGNVITKSFLVDGEQLLTGDANELSLCFSMARPNRRPKGLTAQTDSDDLKWVEPRFFNAKTWNECFNFSNTAISNPRPGAKRLIIRVRSLNDATLGEVSINLIYEVYDGYPVIRKWVEVNNNSPNWIKLSDLIIDDIELEPAFRNQTLLTPSERGAGASIVGFSNGENTRGIIVASEVPSALRKIHDNGSSGYNGEHFEWVLGPSETFVSDPTFIYAFSGEVVKTISVPSLALDRTVETSFKKFLKEHLGIAPSHIEIPAPQWATWTNFGPDVSDAIVRQQAQIAARAGFVLFELDDGWQRGRFGIEPNPETFPNLYETCKYVRSLGLKLGLWVACYREPNEKDFKAIPDAAIVPEVQRLGGLAMSFAGDWHKYYANDLVFMHDYYGAIYFKQDFTNIKFGDLAAGHYSRTRKESLLRGIRGLFASQDILRRLAPSVANELTHEIYWGTPGVPCDLAILKHAAIYHIPPNDYSGVGHWKQRAGSTEQWDKMDPEALRKQLIKGCLNARNRFYLHRGLPLECIEYFGAATVNVKGSLNAQVQDRQVCSWLMGAPLLYSGDLASLTEENIRHYRKRFELLKRLHKQYAIYRNFQYSGVPAPTDTDWHWWGKLNDEGRGAVVVIRGSDGRDKRAVNIPWVLPEKAYSVKALLADKDMGTYSGSDLQKGELAISLLQYGQEILELNY